MAQLSDEDRAAAEAEKICRVFGSLLVSVGKPIRVTVKTRAGDEHTMFLSCAGCEPAIKDPPRQVRGEARQAGSTCSPCDPRLFRR